jgi:hypothetical protein
MKLFNRKIDNVFPFQGKVVGYVLGLAGLLYLLDSPLIGLSLLVLSILIVFTNYGVVLNLKTLTYKEYWGLFGLQFGSWKNLPKLWRITITNDKIVSRNQSHATGLSTYSTNTKTALNLRINDRDFVRIAKGKFKDIMADALFLSGELGLEILDATKEKKEIINPKENSIT